MAVVVPALDNLKVVPFMELVIIASEMVAVTSTPEATPVVFAAGTAKESQLW
jgi:hypothetical protein